MNLKRCSGLGSSLVSGLAGYGVGRNASRLVMTRHSSLLLISLYGYIVVNSVLVILVVALFWVASGKLTLPE